jgi:DNA-binding LacI/PurR family transcriptional regulator
MNKATEKNDRSKFADLRDQIVQQILSGEYRDGDRLLPEEDLAERFAVSRVTVRKALESLKSEGIVESVRGSGTRVTLRNAGHQGSLETVVLIAPAYEQFFASFLEQFEIAAAAHDALVVFKHDASQSRLEAPELYGQFLKRGMRDFVLWPGRGFPDTTVLPRLRGLGINMVFFDHFVETPHADCVQLDNHHAITTLYKDLARRCSTLHYLGWSDVPLSSTVEREAAFVASARPGDRVFKIAKHQGGQAQVESLLAGLRKQKKLPDGLVCVSGDMGKWASQALAAAGIHSVSIACIDEIPPIHGLHITQIEQPLDRLAEQVFKCLRQQNALGKRWRGQRHLVKGALRGANK